jgi:Holliday junction resolvase RusA-like endonuclease
VTDYSQVSDIWTPPHEFTIPGKCISINASYKRGRGNRLYLSPEAEEFRQRIEYAVVRARAKPCDGPCALWLDLYLHSPRQDIDGPLKALLDGLQAKGKWGLYVNDKQLHMLTVRKYLDPKNPRVEVRFVSYG